MRKKAIMITGAAGEIGHALIEALSKQDIPLLTLDLVDLPEDVQGLSTHIQGDILNESLLARLVSDMAETMYAAPGVGLAANQVGVLKRVFVIDIASDDEPSDLHVFINPEIRDPRGSKEGEEGCLCLPEVYVQVRRAAECTIRAQDLDGNPFEIKAEELLGILRQDPWRSPPPLEKLLGDLAGAYSRRINIQHRLVYQIIEDQRVVKVLRMWTHYE